MQTHVNSDSSQNQKAAKKEMSIKIKLVLKKERFRTLHSSSGLHRQVYINRFSFHNRKSFTKYINFSLTLSIEFYELS